jgi:hypothetical protein
VVVDLQDLVDRGQVDGLERREERVGDLAPGAAERRSPYVSAAPQWTA